MSFDLDSTSCVICNGIMKPYDCCDFNKNCEENRGKVTPLALKPVYYYRCGQCGFLNAPAICSWSKSQFKQWIYNDGYAEFDPDFGSQRPKSQATTLVKTFGFVRGQLKILDYGGGGGELANLLRLNNFNAQNYDPFYDDSEHLVPDGRFDLITAFEVIEHVPDPRKMMSEVISFLKQDGIFLFSTLISDGHVQEVGRLTWWYASPRNGHISLFTKRSLQILAQHFGLQFHSFSEGMHMVYRVMPTWAQQAFSTR